MSIILKLVCDFLLDFFRAVNNGRQNTTQIVDALQKERSEENCHVPQLFPVQSCTQSIEHVEDGAFKYVSLRFEVTIVDLSEVFFNVNNLNLFSGFFLLF